MKENSRINTELKELRKKVAESKIAEEKTAHLNKVLHSIRKVSKIISSEKDRCRLIIKACNVLTDDRGYYNAWIVLFNEHGSVECIAQAGLGKEFTPLKDQMYANKFPECAKKALDQTEAVIIHEPDKTCKACSLSKYYSNRGAISVRIAHHNKIWGLLTVSIPSHFLKEQEEHELFEEIANDLGIALHTIYSEEKLNTIDHQLKHNENILENILDNSTNLFFSKTTDHVITYVSPQVEEFLGYSAEEAMINWADHTSDNPINEAGLKHSMKAIETGKRQPAFELELLRKDGKKIWVEVREAPVLVNGKIDSLSGSLTDITEHKKAENIIYEREKFLSNLMDSIPAPVFYKDINGKYLGFNKAFEKFFGADKDKLIGKSAFDISPLKLADEYNKKDLELFKHGGLQIYESKVKAAHGKEYDVIFYKSIFHVKFDKVKGLIGTILDITDRKRAEEALRESEEKFRILSETSPSAIMLYQDNKWVYANNAAIKISGYSYDELMKMNFWDFVHPDYVEKVKKIGKNRQNRKAAENNYEFKIISKSGKVKWVWLNGANAGYNGKPASIITVNDITAHKLAEQQLQESEKKYKQLIETTSQGFWLLGPDEITTEVNNSLCEMLGYSKDEIIGKSPMEFFDAENRYKLRQQTSKIADTLHRSYEIEIKKKDGSNLPVLSNATTLFDENGKLLGSFSLIKDISYLKEAERELIKAKDKAEESDRLKSAFLANMSHEIRTPMNGILGFSDLLKEPDLTSDDQQKYIGIIEKSGERMLNTINDLIDISRIEAGLVEIKKSETNINEQIDYFLSFFKPEAQNKNIDLTSSKALPDNEAFIQTDSEKLYAILTNLIKNAIKFTNQGSIIFGYEIKDNFFEFFVKDTGTGIASNRQKAIFERFIQADLTLSKPYEGSGLGLTITKAFVEMLGGEIWVESKEREGSSFYFTLPKLNDKYTTSIPDEQVKTSDMPKNKLSNLTVLIAEDEESGIMYLSELLESKCKKLLFAETGLQAVEILRENPEVDLILMDIKMQVMDGYTATREIRKFNKEVIIIAQTAHALSGDREKSLEAGCNDYISKPIIKSKLIDIIEKNLKQNA